MRYQDKKTLLMANKNDQRLSRINDGHSSARQERRQYKGILEKFSKLVPDKYWFNSLSFDEKKDVYNEYRFKRFSWQFDSCTFIDKQIFWEEMKISFPGNLAKRREEAINIIFRK